MTTITAGPDGQPRFDGMTGKALADELHQMASRFADRGFSGSSYMTMEAAATALRHLSGRDEWHPIETAPRDGTEILTVGLDSKCVVATKWLSPGPFVRGVLASYHQPDGWYWASWSEPVGAITPTHWRPLPPPPKGTAT